MDHLLSSSLTVSEIDRTSLLRQPVLQRVQLLLDGCHLEPLPGLSRPDVGAATKPSSLRSTCLVAGNTHTEWVVR